MASIHDATQAAVTSLEEAVGEASDPPRQAHEGRMVGLLGPRGSGKTTALSHLMNEAKKNGGNTNNNWHFLRALDCSAQPSTLTPGVAALLAIKHALPDNEKLRPAREGLEGVARLHAESDPEYRQLCLQLAAFPGEYTERITAALETRTELARRAAQVVRMAAEDFGVKGFILPLDDFDLNDKTWVRNWIRALLDDLLDSALVVIVCADFDRLLHMAYGEHDVDDLTGRALLDKVMPEPQRAAVEPWTAQQRLSFVETLIEDVPRGIRSHVRHLVPDRPRALQSTFALLKNGGLKRRRDQGTWSPAEWARRLASARGEPLLAREIREEPPSHWAETLEWPEGGVDDWRGMVAIAGLSDREADTGTAVQTPSAGMVDVTGPTDSEALHGFRPLRQPAGRGPQPLDHEPRWGAPLRHDPMYTRPLRDARPDGDAAWAEWLVDLGLDDAAATRWTFLRRWRPGAGHSGGARLRMLPDWGEVQAFFTRNSHERRGRITYGESLGPSLAWLRVSREPAQPAIVWLGWEPLLASLDAGRSAVPLDLVDSAFAPRASFADAFTPLAGIRPGDLLPKTTRGIILLLDALDRAPWAFLSEYGPNWTITSMLKLSAALVRTAYLDAMLVRNELERAGLSEQDKVVLGWLQGAPLPSLQNDTGVTEQLPKFLPDDDPLNRGTGVIGEAAREFRKVLLACRLDQLA